MLDLIKFQEGLRIIKQTQPSDIPVWISLIEALEQYNYNIFNIDNFIDYNNLFYAFNNSSNINHLCIGHVLFSSRVVNRLNMFIYDEYSFKEYHIYIYPHDEILSILKYISTDLEKPHIDIEIWRNAFQ